MKKYALIFLVIVAALYFLISIGSYPGKIKFREIAFGSKEDINNTVDQEYEIFSYRNESNTHALIFGIRNDSPRTLDDFSSLYLSNFERQGFKFSSEGNRHLGINKDEIIYMTEAQNINGVVIYLEKSANTIPSNPSDAGSVFADLENFSF